MSREILSGRTTTSKKIPEIDSLYAYATRHKVKFTHRLQSGIGYRYTNHNALERAAEDEIHIYHRTAKIRGVRQGLTMVTKNGKVAEVEAFFKDQIKAIEADDRLFDRFNHAGASPIELGLYFTY